MANVKITELTAATALAGTDVLPIVDVGADATKKVSVSDLLRNLPDGTASAPALAFADDQNTGVLSPAANELAFATSGTQRLVIDSSGNVGINTTTPNHLLDVEKADAAIRVNALTGNSFAYLSCQDNTGIAGILFGDAGSATTGRIQYRNNGDSLAFDTNGSERLRIDSSGRVGIANSSMGSLYGGGDDLVVGDGGDTHQGITIYTGTGRQGIVCFADGTSGAAQQYAGYLIYDHDGDRMAFATTGQERMRIDSSGRVGVGDSNPNFTLDVNGNVGIREDNNLTFHDGAGVAAFRIRGTSDNKLFFERASGNEHQMVIDDGNVGIGTTSPVTSLHVDGSGSQYIRVSSSTNSNFIQAGCGSGSTFHEYKSVYRLVDTDNGERMRVDSSGNVGIGTSSPYSASGYNSLTLNGSTGSQIRFRSNDADKGLIYTDASSFNVYSTTGVPLVFTAGAVERMRIASDGHTNIYTNTSVGIRTARTSSSQTAFFVSNGASSTSTGTIKFQVMADGDCENTNNTYTSISDIKLKENIVDANSQWDDIKALRVRNYNFKEETNFGTHTQIGLVAQEVEIVSPGLVKERNDEDAEGNDLGTTTKSVSYSVLYMKAVKALQEAMDRIETLEAKVAALEAQ